MARREDCVPRVGQIRLDHFSRAHRRRSVSGVDPFANVDEPLDSDWLDVPPALRELHRQTLHVLTDEGFMPSTVVVIPSLWAHARRLEEGDE